MTNPARTPFDAELAPTLDAVPAYFTTLEPAEFRRQRQLTQVRLDDPAQLVGRSHDSAARLAC